MKSNINALFIRWLDTCTSPDEWTDKDAFTKWAAAPIEPDVSLGFLAHVCPTHLVLTSTAEADHGSAGWKIPRGCIIELRNAVPGPPLNIEDIMGHHEQAPMERSHVAMEAQSKSPDDS